MTKPTSDNWRELPIDEWNSRTFFVYLCDLTEERFGISYEPRGSGTKSQRYAREMGMINNARKKYGNDVLKQYIRICVENYQPNERYPYLAFAFAWTYMSDYLPVAQAQVAKDRRDEERRQAAETKKLDIDFL